VDPHPRRSWGLEPWRTASVFSNGQMRGWWMMYLWTEVLDGPWTMYPWTGELGGLWMTYPWTGELDGPWTTYPWTEGLDCLCTTYLWTEELDGQWTEELDGHGGFDRGICSVFAGILLSCLCGFFRPVRAPSCDHTHV